MIQTLQIQNEPKSDSRFRIFRVLTYLAPVCFGPRGRFRAWDFGFSICGFVSDFDIRISDFFRRVLGAINFFKLVLFNNSMVSAY